MMAELHEVMHLIVRHILLPSSGSTPYILTFAPNTEIRNHGMMGAINLKKLPASSLPSLWYSFFKNLAAKISWIAFLNANLK